MLFANEGYIRPLDLNPTIFGQKKKYIEAAWLQPQISYWLHYIVWI
jgi:hypothetical protein